MRRGVVFPQTEFGNDPAAIKDYAQAAEGLGYEYTMGAGFTTPQADIDAICSFRSVVSA